MKEINIAKMLAAKRKEKGITQDELAAYIGVTKASVSKWETGQSYPDITFLPQLAAYFNISIDELIGYEPQMVKEDIKKLYHRLSSEFGKKPFNEVLEECHVIIKKYYSCFPLLLQMSTLLINHYMLAAERKEQESILRDIIELCGRIKSESGDLKMSKQANYIEAVCHLSLGHPANALELLEGTEKPTLNDIPLLVQAYQMLGNVKRAKEALQISMYTELVKLAGNASIYLMLHINDKDKFDEILHRTLSIAELFSLDSLHPNTMLHVYMAAAQGYAMQKNNEKALDMLKRYSDICTSDSLNFSLHGDMFFDSIDVYLDDFDLGKKSPRDEKIIKESMVKLMVSNPAFVGLADQSRFKSIVEALKSKLKVK